MIVSLIRRGPMCLYKSQTRASNYCKFQLSSDIEKNPGPTPMYIDPSKTIMTPYSQANELSHACETRKFNYGKRLYKNSSFNKYLLLDDMPKTVDVCGTERVDNSSCFKKNEEWEMETQSSLAGIQIKATDYAQQYFPCKSTEKALMLTAKPVNKSNTNLVKGIHPSSAICPAMKPQLQTPVGKRSFSPQPSAWPAATRHVPCIIQRTTSTRS
ncbi:hypothetical protein pdam_00024754 [Pocillopora damicornis]|uniref:Uncharacterized protein n=1 Tax=Pocillopora damicornis TaxID=46731 RepID=A0A3M6U2F8_POCDA|nr:hypothetical protein pdam_00024754 [Pocillopora damicornis]